MTRRVVVVGYGMAGARLAEELRRRDPAADRVRVTVLGAERHTAYNRVLLPAVAAGALRPETVALHDESWATEHHVRLRTGVTATAVDRQHRRVHLDDGSTEPYDALVIATGATAWRPPVDGITDDGVLALRTLDDCLAIRERAVAGTPVAVVGGGVLGIEAARALAARGSLVTVVHPVGHLMERQLDPAAGALLAGELGALGVDFRLGTAVAAYLPGDGLKLADGSHVPADLVVVSAGARANTALAADAGIAVDKGILVDDALRTSDGRIHAIGDCAQHPGTVSGLVQPAWEQAAVLADLLTGTDAAARYRGTPVQTRLKADGVDLAAFGDTLADADTAEVLTVHDPHGGRYAKLVVRNGKVTGAILLGFPESAATITHFHDRAIPVPDDRLGLLLGGAVATGSREAGPSELPATATVCRCNGVTKGRLVEAFRSGATSRAQLVDTTRATTGCGGCTEAVHGIADWLAATA